MNGTSGAATRRCALAAGALVPAALLAACGAAPGGQTGGAAQAKPSDAQTKPGDALTRKDEQAQVTVEVTWAGPAAGPVFGVVMDTHVVDLDGYDLRELATLRTATAEGVRPVEWQAPKGGHHRKGTLSFPAAIEGKAVVTPGTGPMELVIRDVAGVPARRFTWTL
ncbi:MAG TPA: hypothetical protein VFX49_21150 [Chloroflexota bacterium]|nr:hypothetical protein [Chloroflexota bacterium]